MRQYRASSLGGCLKSQVAAQLGHTPLPTPDHVQGWYDRGNEHEVECLAAMEADGWPLVELLPGTVLNDKYGKNQMYQEWEVAGAVFHNRYDGGLSGPFRVLEIKSPQSWAKWEKAHKTGDYSDPLMNRYAWQISAYMAATGLEAVIACVDDGRVKTFGIEVGPHSYDEIVSRVGELEKYVISGQLPLECSQADYPCPFAYLHEKPETVEDEDLDSLVADYQAALAMEKEAKSLKTKYRDGLLAHLGEAEKLETAASKVTRYTTSRATLDKDDLDIFLTEHGARLADFEKRSESESIRVTMKKVDGPSPL